jgi:hypothetical protein
VFLYCIGTCFMKNNNLIRYTILSIQIDPGVLFTGCYPRHFSDALFLTAKS